MSVIKKSSPPFGGPTFLVMLTALSVIAADKLEAAKTVSSGKYLAAVF